MLDTDRIALIDNRYRIVRKLGEGGMGVVYLVEDRLNDGREVALKKIRPEEVNEESIRYFQQEFEALAGLRHPNLCEVYDFGVLERAGEFYFTLEYLTGTDLFSATRDAPVGTILDDLVQVCRSLEYIHSRGFIHHDLKPANVMVVDGPQRRVKLMDFGLVRQESQMRVEVRGTLNYIAPEMFDGGAVDRRSDLYSLGILLYKIVRGKLPVEDRPTDQAADFYMGLLPRPPSERELEVLDEPYRTIVGRLVRVNPAERYRSANQVIEEVNRFVERPHALETKATSESYILSSRLVGRDDERRVLTRLLDEFRDRSLEQPFWLIQGERGIGKSRLTREFRIQCQLDGVPCYFGSAYEQGGEAYGPFRAILREVVSMLGPEHPAVAAYARTLSILVPELVEPPAGARSEAEGGNEEKIRLFDDVSSFLFEAAKSRSFVVCFQDVNWAGPESIDLLRYFVRSYHLTQRAEGEGVEGAHDSPPILSLWDRGAPGPRLLVLATCRSEDFAGTDLARAIEDLEEDGFVSRVELAGLDVEAIQDLLRHMFSLPAPPGARARRRFEATPGNPLFIEEVMKHLVDGGRIVKEAGSWTLQVEPDAVEMPASLEEVLLGRFDQFDADTRRLLELVAVYGRPVLLRDLVRLTEGWGRSPRLLLRDLERRLVLERNQDEEDVSLQFHHGAGREVLYRSLEPARRTDLHRHIASTLEEAYGSDPGRILDDLAYHSLRSGDRPRAIRYNLQAADRNRDLFAYRKALDLYEQVLDLAGEDPAFAEARLSALQELGDVAKRTGDYERGLSRLEAYLASEPEGIGGVWAERLTGEILTLKGDYEGSLVRFERARAALEGSVEEHPRAVAMLELNLARVLELRGEFEKARAHGEAGLWVTGLKGLWRERGAALSILGNICWSQGDVDGALRYHQRCLELYDERENPYGLAVAYNNIGILYHEKGEPEKALASYGRSLELYERIGSPAGMALCYSNIGIVYEERGEREQAIEYHGKAVEILRRIGDRTGEARTIECLAAVYGAMGQWEESEKYHNECLEICRRIGNTPLSIYAYLNLGENHSRMGALEQAIEYIRQGIELAGSTGSRMLEGVGRGLLGEALRQRGDLGGARRELEAATAIFEEVECSTEMTKVRVRLAALLADEHEAVRARELAERAFREAVSARTQETIGQAALLLGRIDLAAGSVDRALEMAREAVQVGTELRLPVFNWAVHHQYGRILCARGEYKEAKEAFLRAVEEARMAWTRIPADHKEEFLADPRHMELSRDIKSLREKLSGGSR